MRIACITISALLLTLVHACHRDVSSFKQDLGSLDWHIWLDSLASWEGDSLHLPPVDLGQLPVQPPSPGWGRLEKPGHVISSLPATVEQYFWNNEIDTAWGAGDYRGVSWFYTKVMIPAELEGKHVFLDFESVRLRAEVYVNHHLAGYDCVGNTPFQVEIGPHLDYGRENQIAIRITDPGGNYYWEDYHLDRWGAQYIPPSHGFGGITGGLSLRATDDIHISDLYIQNQPDFSKIRVFTTLQHLGSKSSSGVLELCIREPGKDRCHLRIPFPERELAPGTLVLDTLLDIPAPQAWSPSHPRLYTLEARWKNGAGKGDLQEKRFGLRWFEAREVDGHRSFYLNGERIFITSAISWGFWPGNGIFPTEKLARKQILNLKALGLNMFNFHRAIGQTRLLELADELGMLVYEEPGGYRCPTEKIWFWKPEDEAGNSIMESQAELAWQWRSEKLRRMVRRDRSHPSLVIYNLGNEMLMDPDDRHKEDMAAAHQLDPSRYLTFSSHSFHPEFFPEYPEGDCPPGPAPAKLYMEPFNKNFLYEGWWDNHHALGEGTYRDHYYQGPEDYRRWSDNTKEIVFFGEEGAIHAPGRYDSIIPLLRSRGNPGWDGDYYLRTDSVLREYLTEKGFSAAGVDLGSLLTAFANNSYDYHARMIEHCRMGNVVDAYVINGLEDPKRSFCSGILDIYRHIKGDPEILAAAMEDLYLVPRLPQRVIRAGDSLWCDMYIVNEDRIRGDFQLEVHLLSGKDTLSSRRTEVRVTGGQVHGELLAARLGFPVSHARSGSHLSLKASLLHAGQILAEGSESIFLPGTSPSAEALYFMGKQGPLSSYLAHSGTRLIPFQPPGKESGLLLLSGPCSQERLKEILAWVFAGNQLLLLDPVLPVIRELHREGSIELLGVLDNSEPWSAGGFFNREHPVFAGLPAGGILGWEYQDLAHDCPGRYSLQLRGETAITGALGAEQHQVGTAMGELSHGRGSILFCTLPVEAALQKDIGVSLVAGQLLKNMLNYMNSPR